MEYFKKRKGIILLVIGFIGLFIVNIDKIKAIQGPSEYSDVEIFTTSEILTSNNIYVEIKGEVLTPGVYCVKSNLRIGEVIELAGGLTSEADIDKINQAAKIYDEMIIEIPRDLNSDLDKSNLVRIVVEIKGEVINPGIYNMYYNSRVIDLIEQAGGFSSIADTSNLDLARVLLDGETIIVQPQVSDSLNLDSREIYVEITGEVIHPGVYSIPEDYSIQELIYDAGGVTNNCDISKINWNLKLVLGATIYMPSYEDEVVVSSDDYLTNINTSDLEKLILLPGIGDILGQRIIDYRAEYGNFLSIEDIMKVSGIKTSIYDQIKEYITV